MSMITGKFITKQLLVVFFCFLPARIYVRSSLMPLSKGEEALRNVVVANGNRAGFYLLASGVIRVY